MILKKVDARKLDAAITFDRSFDAIEKMYGRSYRPPEVKVRLRRGRWSSGRTWGMMGRAWSVVVTLGTDPLDAAHVIVHEAAHCMPDSEGHEESFYLNMFKLVAALGMDKEHAIAREKVYKPRVMNKMMKRGRIK